MVPRERQGNCRIRWGLSAPHTHVAGHNLLHAVVASRATSASDSTPVLTERIAKPAGGHDCQALGVQGATLDRAPWTHISAAVRVPSRRLIASASQRTVSSGGAGRRPAAEHQAQVCGVADPHRAAWMAALDGARG